jgi:cytidyltransferase-like protein
MKEKKVASLFVGRWQPFHAGHRALIETVLKKKKPVVIAIRDTDISHKNPYSLEERWTLIQKALRKYGELVKIITVPDIEEICYGRDVGYAIRYVEVGEKMKRISGTKARAKNPPTRGVIWLSGQSGSGKSTLARALKKEIPDAVVLDGDEMRESISLGAGFSKQDRDAHNMRVARLAKVLAKQSPVIVSVIAPFRSTRVKIDKIAKPLWVYVARGTQKKSASYPYEVPASPDVVIESDEAPRESARCILAHIKKSGFYL